MPLLLARGYADITVAEIAAAADVGRSTFYEHYPGKDALLRASIAGPFGVLAGVVDGATSAAGLERCWCICAGTGNRAAFCSRRRCGPCWRAA